MSQGGYAEGWNLNCPDEQQKNNARKKLKLPVSLEILITVMSYCGEWKKKDEDYARSFIRIN